MLEILKGKKIVVLGERDEIPDMAIKAVLKAAGVEAENVVHAVTECFV